MRLVQPHALEAVADQLDEAGLGPFVRHDAGAGGHAREPFGLARPAHLGAAFEQHHPERLAVAQALADHLEVTHLEYPQRQHAVGQKHGAQRKQRQPLGLSIRKNTPRI